ncbi:uroporphyrinogen-III synthase [Sphingomonas sp.]|uniref:uroporphyrinogen-III synthase n=1 Tax=Sphingomonas sp. TaxID=28214 RepID=UPI0038AF94BC
MKRVLVLRPQAGADATVGKARAMGLEAAAVPLFEVEPVEWQAPEADEFDGLLLTSANALRAGGDGLQRLRALKVYAVGETTGEAAREAGFDVAATGDAGVDRLLGSIGPELRLLHLCGADRAAPSDARHAITPVTVYRSIPLPAPDLTSADGCVVLVHSPRAGARFAELVRDRGAIAVAAISVAAADAVGSGWRVVETADQPTDAALLALAARLCNKPDPE